MKFLFFNVLVGAALAWLLLAAAPDDLDLASRFDGSEPAEPVASCPSAVVSPPRKPAGLGNPAEKVETAAPDHRPEASDEPVSTPDKATRGMVERQTHNDSGNQPAEPIADYKSEVAVDRAPKADRRSALLSLAESMELFAVDRTTR